MNARNYSVIVIILLLVAAIVGFLAFKVNRMSDGLRSFYEEKETLDLAEELNSYDYHIYLIGELPEYMEPISSHVTVLAPALANSNNLPVNEGNSTMTVYNPDGDVVSHREQRDYAANMFIMINTTEEISDSSWEIIRNCTVENQVPVLLIGDSSINAFREYMILVRKDYDASSSMLFTFTREPLDNPIDPSVVAQGGRDYANALIEFFISRIENPVVVYVSSDNNAEGNNAA